jgi:protein-tyrosine phosphatase
MATKAGLSDRFLVDSAGSSSWLLGKQPHQKILETLKEHNIEFSHEARMIHLRDLSSFNFVLAMDNEVIKSIWSMGKGTAKVQPFVRYLAGSGLDSIPDPLEDGNFEQTFELVQAGCQKLLSVLAS